MRFLADEHLPRSTVRTLREAGHDVVAVAEEAVGAPDVVLLERAARETRVVVTFDRDFGELIFRAGQAAPPGVVYFRIARVATDFVSSVLLWLASGKDIHLEGQFTVVEEWQIRQRPLPAVGLDA